MRTAVNLRKRRKAIRYLELLGFTCAHPECQSGIDLQGHHINPLKNGGEDKYWNIISLCKQCHRKKPLHSSPDDVAVELFTYKCYHELEFLGFVMDERDPEFRANLHGYYRAKRGLPPRKPAKKSPKPTGLYAGNQRALRNGEPIYLQKWQLEKWRKRNAQASGVGLSC